MASVRPALKILILSLIMESILSGCGIFRDEVVVIETDLGKIVVELFPGDAPNHVERFRELAAAGFYDGLVFHRVVPGFVIQAGDPATRDPSTPRSRYGAGGSGVRLEAEFNERHHLRGTVSMARSADVDSGDSLFYDTADSQFFICLEAKPHLDGLYTIFGQVIAGMETADLIARLPRDEMNVPVHPVTIRTMTILSRRQALKSLKQ